jgi:hypothetical protein
VQERHAWDMSDVASSARSTGLPECSKMDPYNSSLVYHWELLEHPFIFWLTTLTFGKQHSRL